MSTAAAPISAPADHYARRRDEVVWFLRSRISTDEAEAMASPGYRYLPCGACARHHCRWCSADAPEQVRTSGRRASADPRHVMVTLNRTAWTDPLLLARGMPALAGLPPGERHVLVLEFGAGLRQDEIAARLKISRPTVARLRERALSMMVAGVWGE